MGYTASHPRKYYPQFSTRHRLEDEWATGCACSGHYWETPVSVALPGWMRCHCFEEWAPDDSVLMQSIRLFRNRTQDCENYSVVISTPVFIIATSTNWFQSCNIQVTESGLWTESNWLHEAALSLWGADSNSKPLYVTQRTITVHTIARQFSLSRVSSV